MNDLFGLGSIFGDLKTALEVVSGTVITCVIVIGIILMVLRSKAGAELVKWGLIGFVLSIVIFGPLLPYLHSKIHG